jgi:SulP family sulfate permease
MNAFKRYFPILDWGKDYDRGALGEDLTAAVIVTLMLIPQSLAYAMLAGLPPEAGLYASIAPILLYAVFGTSRALAVGPVAVVSLLTASAIGQVVEPGTAGYAAAALTLAFLSGAILLALGLLRLGFLANFLSHPVIAGFITASGVLIATSQLKHVLGISAEGHSLIEMGISLVRHAGDTHLLTAAIGLGALVFLFFVRSGLNPLLTGLGVPARTASFITKAGPVFAVIATTALTWGLDLEARGVAVVGVVPQTLPPLTAPDWSPELIRALFIPAVLISIIGFVESVSVAKTLAAKKRQRIDADQELIGLGAANLGAAFTGGYPVTGGFARSVVNFDAGARTPAAGAFTALGLALAALTLTPLIYFLPKATLAATIIVAVLSLVDFSILKATWRYSTSDFIAVFATIALTLSLGVEAGVAAGVGLSLLLHVTKTFKPHIAEVGRVPGTEHFRNIHRHQVETTSSLVTLRIDESLYFANANFLEDMILKRLSQNAEDVRNVVLMFSAVNEVDYSALETLEALNARLEDMGVRLHLSEVKGPVMDKLKHTHFLTALTGEVFLSQHDAWAALSRPSQESESP